MRVHWRRFFWERQRRFDPGPSCGVAEVTTEMLGVVMDVCHHNDLIRQRRVVISRTLSIV